MARVEPSGGLALWDERLSFRNIVPRGPTVLESAYSEDAPQPDDPVALGRMRAYVSGSQSADVEVEIMHPGTARRDGARVGIKVDDGPLLGAFAETEFRAWEMLEPSTASNRWNALGACANSKGEPIVTACSANDAITRRYNGTSWVTVAGQFVNAAGYGEEGCAIARDESSGALVMARFDGQDLRVWHSYDDGSTFELVSSFEVNGAVTTLIAKTCSRMAMAATGSGLCVILQAADASGDCYQLASSDLGLSWTFVGSYVAEGLGWSIATINNDLHVWFYKVASSQLSHVVMSNPYANAATAPEFAVSGRTGLQAVAGWADLTGTLYTMAVDSSGGALNGVMVPFRSFDGGANWKEQPDTLSTRASNAGPRNMVAVHTRYGALIVCNGASPSDPDQDESVHLLWLGGWSNYEHNESTAAAGAWSTPGTMFLPFAQPGAGPWSKTGAGTGANSDDGFEITGEATYDSPMDSGLGTGWFDCRVDGGGVLTSLDAGLRFKWVNGTTIYEIKVRLDATGIRLYDQRGATVLATVLVDTSGGAWASRYQFALNYETLRYRKVGELEWTEVVHGCTSDTATETPDCEWGTFDVSSAPDVKWFAVGFGEVGLSAADSGGRAAPCFLPDVVGAPATLHLVDGPGFAGASAVVPVGSEYAAEAMDPRDEPSPDVPWRSTSDATPSDFVWDLGADTELGDAVALAVAGAAVRRVRLSYYDGSWNELVEVNLAEGFEGLTFDRTGDVIRPAAGTIAAGRYIQEGELAGGHIAYASGFARIRWNTGGAWAEDADVQPVIYIEDTSGPVTGAIDILAPAGVAVQSAGGAVSARYWRVRVPNDASPNGRHEVGSVLVGRVLPWGAAPDWGWVDEVDPNVARSESSAGTARSRELGRPARVWSAGWGDGVLLRPLREAGSSPEAIDGVGLAGGVGLVADGDVWWSLAGALRSHQALPVVALRRIPSDGSTFTDRTLFLYGYLSSGVAARGFAGFENQNEAMRIEKLVVSEQR